jgi:hypothetical protein
VAYLVRADGLSPYFPRIRKGELFVNPQILVTDITLGLNLTLAESLKGASFPLTKGPFTLQLSDPANTVQVNEGSADQTTPTNFVANGTGNLGTFTFTVTDTSVTPPLVSNIVSVDVVAAAPPPPPAQPDTLTAGVVANTVPFVPPPAATPSAAVKKA